VINRFANISKEPHRKPERFQIHREFQNWAKMVIEEEDKKEELALAS
jgi:hypothetical protein